MKSDIQIAHVHLETQLVIKSDWVQLLIVENPSEFYQMVADLDKQFDGEEGDFVFSASGQIVNPSKLGVMVSDWFHFDLNDKKVLSLLYKSLETVALSEKVADFHELTSKTVAFLEDLAYISTYALEYNEPQPTDYLKCAGVKFAQNYDSLEEKIVCYINALIELKKCEFFVFVNLKSVLSDEKLLQIYAHCQAEQVGLLLIEPNAKRKILSCEKAVIITEDLCEILANCENL